MSNDSEKHGKPRRFKVAEKLIGMLKSLIRRIRGSFRQPIARAPDSHHAKLHLYLEGLFENSSNDEFTVRVA